MLFVITTRDKEGGLPIRLATRDAHLGYLADAGDRIKLAGPMMSPGDDPKPTGSMILIDAASEAAVQLFVNNDPYMTAGLTEQADIRHWNAAAGDWIPE